MFALNAIGDEKDEAQQMPCLAGIDAVMRFKP